MSDDARGLTIAAGPIAVKQETFAFAEDYTEGWFIGTMGSSKSRSLCLDIITTAIDYPGCRLFLCRDELATLKKTTLDTLLTMLSQAGLRQGDLRADKNAGFQYNKNDAIIEIRSQNRISRVFCFGLNTGDYKEKLKSFEPFRIYIDEAHAVGEEKVEFALTRQGRDRDGNRHRLTYRERIEDGMQSGKFESYEDGMDFFRITEKELNTHGEGRGYVKCVSNDHGNDWVWQRVVNPRGDKPHPDSSNMSPLEFEKWIHENVGITQLFISPEQGPRFRPGNMVRLKDGRGAEVIQVVGDELVVDVGNSKEVASRFDTTMVLERLCVYGFSLENHSLSEGNIEGFWYVSEKTRNQFLYGLTDVKTGLLFPMFNADAHVVPQAEIPDNWWVWVGLDYNVDIVAASFIAENNSGDLVIFDEYEGFEGVAASHAAEIIARIDHPWERVRVFYDSSMRNRDPVDPSKSVAKIYEEAGLRRMRMANKDRGFGIQLMRELLEVKHMPGYAPRPRLWVMDNCRTTIEGSTANAGLSNITWEEFEHKKRDHLVADAARYALASRAKHRPDTEQRRSSSKGHARVWSRA